MSDEKPQRRKTIETFGSDFGFALIWSVLDHWADVEVVQISAREDGGRPLYTKADWVTLPEDMTADLDAAERYAKGFVKWDGCSEIEQGKPHWCSPDDYVRHCQLLEHIYRRAFELMGREPEEPWPESPLDAFAAGLKKRLGDALLGGTVSDYQGYGIDLDAYIDAYLAEFKGKP